MLLWIHYLLPYSVNLAMTFLGDAIYETTSKTSVDIIMR